MILFDAEAEQKKDYEVMDKLKIAELRQLISRAISDYETGEKQKEDAIDVIIGNVQKNFEIK